MLSETEVTDQGGMYRQGGERGEGKKCKGGGAEGEGEEESYRGRGRDWRVEGRRQRAGVSESRWTHKGHSGGFK